MERSLLMKMRRGKEELFGIRAFLMADNRQLHKAAPRKKQVSRKELVLYTRIKAVFCMFLFAVAVVVCVKVVQGLTRSNAIASAPQNTGIIGDAGNAKQADVPAKTPKEDDSKPTDGDDSAEKPEGDSSVTSKGYKIEVIDGRTYIDGVIIANKSYPLPKDYDPGLNSEAQAAFDKLSADAYTDGISLFICSDYRSYSMQTELYNGYVAEWGKKKTDTFSARPGHSEHQTGFAMDINDASDDFIGTPEAEWLEKHCTDYGFIIRYKKDKEAVTGFKYEPWHIRYLGVELAKKVEKSGLCLEEYFGIDSVYAEDRPKGEKD